MSKQERAAWLSLIVEGVVAVYYFSAIVSMGPTAGLHGMVMAGLIGKVIILAIVLGIISEIVMRMLVREARDRVEADERDMLIAARSYRNGYYALVLGACLLIGQIVLSEGARTWWMRDIMAMSPVFAAHLLLLALMIAGAVVNISRVFYYRRGH